MIIKILLGVLAGVAGLLGFFYNRERRKRARAERVAREQELRSKVQVHRSKINDTSKKIKANRSKYEKAKKRFYDMFGKSSNTSNNDSEG